MNTQLIPFADLQAQYAAIKDDVDSAIAQVIRETAFISGKFARKFEEEFAAFLGIDGFIGCANGTDSIEILLKAMDIGEGDEVIVPACSWISTSEAVSSVGARPVFVDVEPEYYCIDVEKIEAKLTKKTKAIIPVHLYGQPADMPAIMSLAAKHGLRVLEDCAQAHAAEIQGKMIGTWGDAASFSFYPGKNLGAYGDAGGMAVRDNKLAETARRIANHGQLAKHDHLIEGRNSRLDGIQAAILSVKLPHLQRWTARRIELAAAYAEALRGSAVKVPKIRENAKHVFHLYVIRTSNRVALQGKLAASGIQTAIHYPQALPFLPCYAAYGLRAEDFPIAHRLQEEILSLPMFPELDNGSVQLIASLIEE